MVVPTSVPFVGVVEGPSVIVAPAGNANAISNAPAISAVPPATLKDLRTFFVSFYRYNVNWMIDGSVPKWSADDMWLKSPEPGAQTRPSLVA